jgi:hypothetical protein
MDIGHEVIEQLEWHWTNQLRPRLDGLTDDEWRWEPVDGCWTVHPQPDGTATIDFAFPEPSPPPLTTIAWRLAHVTCGIFAVRASAHFGDGTVSYDTFPWAATADAALAQLDEWHDRWVAGLRSLDVAGWERPCGPAEGPFAAYPLVALALHLNREAIHHGAEIALLRDLYLHR